MQVAQAEVREAIGRHTKLIIRVRDSCEACFDQLMSDPAFERAVAEAKSEHFAKSGPDEPWGAYGEAKLHAVVAERLINNAGVFAPDRTADARFWEFARERLAKFRSGAAFRELDKSRREAAGDTLELATTLVHARAEICEAHDIPAGFVESTS